MSFIYDAGALIAAERGQARFGKLHQSALAKGRLPIVPAVVLAQVWDARAQQALLSRVLRACRIEAFDEERARRVGPFRAASGSTDIVDIAVVECAWRHRRPVITSDPDDLAAIAAAVNHRISIEVI